MVQTCPHCGRRIVTCSMCLACEANDGKNYCSNCCLSKQAELENEEKFPTISIGQAEMEVRRKLLHEQLEDRVYELATELADHYIAEVEKEHTIVDCDGQEVNSDIDTSDEMWYDEIKEEIKRSIFEKLGDWFRQ